MLNYTVRAQNKWPVSPNDGKITCKVFKKWPIGVNTLSQKKKFVRSFYFHRLTDLKEEDMKKWLARTGDEVTYSGLPSSCFFEKKGNDSTHKLLFDALILLKKEGMTISLSKFYFSEIGDDSFNTASVEDIFMYDGFSECKPCKESLNFFKNRINNL